MICVRLLIFVAPVSRLLNFSHLVPGPFQIVKVQESEHGNEHEGEHRKRTGKNSNLKRCTSLIFIPMNSWIILPVLLKQRICSLSFSLSKYAPLESPFLVWKFYRRLQCIWIILFRIYFSRFLDDTESCSCLIPFACIIDTPHHGLILTSGPFGSDFSRRGHRDDNDSRFLQLFWNSALLNFYRYGFLCLLFWELKAWKISLWREALIIQFFHLDHWVQQFHKK